MDDNLQQKPSFFQKLSFALVCAGTAALAIMGIRVFAGGRLNASNVKNQAGKVLDGVSAYLDVGVEAGAIVGAGAYGFYKIEKEHLKKKNQKLEIENAVLKSQKEEAHAGPKKSWVAAEQARSEATSETQPTR